MKPPISKCLLCHKPIAFAPAHLLTRPNKICDKCYHDFALANKHFKVSNCRCYALFYYEGKVKETILQIKVNQDLEVAQNLLTRFLPELVSLFRNYTMIFVPSTPTTNQERGFNHVVEVYRILNLKSEDILYKKVPYKQSDQKYENRKKVRDVIAYKGQLNPHKKYVIVDDIVTSQETLKACIDAARKAGAKHLKCLVLAYNCRQFVTTKTGQKVLKMK